GETPAGEPIRLLNESILNGTILMILITCTIASFVAQKGAKNIALSETPEPDDDEKDDRERILIPVRNIETTDELINLGVTIKSKNNKDGLFALSIGNKNCTDGLADRNAKKLLVKAAVTAASTDNILTELLRYDQNIVNGIKSVIKEHNITDLILGLHIKSELSTSFLGELTESILERSRTTTFIYKSIQPLNTIKRHLIVVPDKAEKETGFPFWLIKVWNIARNTGSTLVFYSSSDTLNYIRQIQKIHPVPCEFEEFNDWQDFLVLSGKCQKNDNLIIILNRKDKLSY